MSEKKPTTAIVKKTANQDTPVGVKEGKVILKDVVVKEEPKLKVTTAKELQPEKSTSKPEAPKPLNMAYLNSELQAVKQVIQEHSQQIVDIQEALARKRKPTNNGKVQIRDKQTGKTYPSKNNCYQSLLKAGELKDVVSTGIFGSADPAKNTFGWYALVRALPDRFEEVKAEQTEKK